MRLDKYLKVSRLIKRRTNELSAMIAGLDGTALVAGLGLFL